MPSPPGPRQQAHQLRLHVADRLWFWFGKIFDADLRSLAAFRIVLAIIVLLDLAGKARNLGVFYTDDGVLPRRVLLTELRPWSISLNLMSGTFLLEAILFGITGIAAICLLLGYRSRLFSIVVWAMVLSIQWRNPFVLHAADELLRVLLFWGMFLPLGAVWSVDRAQQTAPARISNRFVSVGVAGLFLQIAFMYWFAVILKSGAEWRTDGTALSYALRIDPLVSPTGTFLLGFPALLKILSFGTLAIEALAPFLLLSPVLKGPLRTLGVALVMSLHLGILVTMNIGVFPLLSAFCMVCFLPTWFWDTALPRFRKTLPAGLHAKRLTGAIPFLRRRLRTSGIRQGLASIQQAGRSLVTVPAPNGITGSGFSGSGQSPARREGQAMPEVTTRVVRLHASLGSNLLAGFFLVYVLIMNITTVTDYGMPAPAYSGPMSVALGLDQRWAMYSPTPARFSYWFTIPGTLQDGTQINLLPAVAEGDPDLAGAVSLDKPSNVNETFRDIYWLRYMTTLTIPNSEDRLLNFGGYICRSWNAWHPDGEKQLQTFEIIHFTQPSLPDGKRGDIQHQVIWQHRCR